MTAWRLGLLALMLLAAGCAAPTGSASTSYDSPRSRCLGQPGRGESYSPDRPMVYLFCVESP